MSNHNLKPQRAALQRAPIVKQRVRCIAGQTFAFIEHRFLRDGFFASLLANELRVYFLLVLAADRNGVSFYHYDTICSLLELPLEDYLQARNALIDKDLIAFDGTRTQVLSLPEKPRFDLRPAMTTDDQFESDDPATVRLLIRRSLSPSREEK